MTGKNDKSHLLIIRHSAMGDVAMAVPVITALRKANPELKITVLTRPFFRPLLRDVAGVEFIDADFTGRYKGLAGIFRLRNDIISAGITHVADLQDELRTRALRHLLRMTGMKVTVIDNQRDEKRELTRKFRKVMHRLRPTIERYTDVFRKLGFTLADPAPPLRIPRTIPQEILDITGQKTGLWIGIAPFAHKKGKTYPTNMTDELIGLLAGSGQYQHVFVFGHGPYEKEFAECMEQRHPGVVSMIGKVKLPAELDLITNLDATVTMDASAMHLASLMGVPTVSVWGATHTFAGSYGFGQSPDNAIQLDLRCRPCSTDGSRRCMYGDYRCLTGIAPQTIADKVKKQLQ